MGISLYYDTQSPLTSDARQAIREAAELEARGDQTWWSESFMLYEDDDDEEGLRGSTKIFLPGYSVAHDDHRTVDSVDDAVMAWRDTTRILKLLQRLALGHNVVWNVQLEDESFGEIKGGDEDSAAFEKANELLLIAGLNPNDPSLAQRISQIDQLHADRWQQQIS